MVEVFEERKNSFVLTLHYITLHTYIYVNLNHSKLDGQCTDFQTYSNFSLSVDLHLRKVKYSIFFSTADMRVIILKNTMFANTKDGLPKAV
jgi:protease II